jgi:hypothetical protein
MGAGIAGTGFFNRHKLSAELGFVDIESTCG